MTASKQPARSLSSLDDEAARAEAQRLAATAHARWIKHASSFGFASPPPGATVVDPPSPFEIGMLALFRYARGEEVPGFIVRGFLDELLELLFAGLASPALALPRWQRMADRPWAWAWRAAELRLLGEAEAPVELTTLAHLLDRSPEAVRNELERHGVPLEGSAEVPAQGVQLLLAKLRAGPARDLGQLDEEHPA